MKYIEIEVGDGTGGNNPYPLPLLSNHLVVRVVFTGSVDTTLFFQLPDGAEVGDTFELFQFRPILPAPFVQFGVYYPAGEAIFGTAEKAAGKSVYTIKKVFHGDGVNTVSTWLGQQSKD